ncbi:helix-turn-helix domain-containing protein [Ruegeria sp. SCSIO 43209]|uniref:helix-turn-helix domain-containing protein n=1 Tax=Ruegeria sp. SCSIO 43209 TaxID=2793010 RepID=UPI001CA8624B|nr:helix-turn-helix domain-containing protein [Ruegeria sp. SCSIO 43209]
MTKLLTIEQAAELLNVPKGSLRTAAEEHGFLVRIGRVIRLDESQLGELVERCKEPPKTRMVDFRDLRGYPSEAEMLASASRAAQALKELGKGERRQQRKNGHLSN